MKKVNKLIVKPRKYRFIITHNGQNLTFIHPSYGPTTYASIKEEIEKDGLKTPTMAQTVSLVHAAFSSKGKYHNEIQKIMKDRYLCAFTGTLYIPNKGAYIQDYPEITNEIPHMVESELEKKLAASDPNVRFVPFGFDICEITPRELSKNAYVIGLAGEEGAAKLEEITRRLNYQPFLFSFRSVKENISRVSALTSNWYRRDYFAICGDDLGDYQVGRAFGIIQTKHKDKIK